jgi:mannose-6-phosphate isomerase
MGEPKLTDRPIAELWMGAHPNAPSKLLIDGEWKSFKDVIDKDPDGVLGKGVAEKFSNKLPFLFKVLAADKPLSIQVHPNLEQAWEGFAAENSGGIPLTAPNRKYRDENHKPEIFCALTPFLGLKGFRRIQEILGLMEKVLPLGLSHELGLLRKEPNTSGLKRFFTAVINMDKSRQSLIVSEAARFAEKSRHSNG